MDNEKTQLMVDIDALQIRHREVSDLTIKATADLHLLEEGKVSITAEIARLREDFNVLNNSIAEQKLDWLQQKTREEGELADKRSKMDEILAKESFIEASARETEKKRMENQEILNQSNKSLDESKKESVASQALVNQANDIRLQAEEKDRKAGEKIGAFKAKLKGFHAKIIEEFE